MKNLLTTVAVMAMVLFCANAMALTLTINYGSGTGTGAVDIGGSPYLVGHKYSLFPTPTQDFVNSDLVELYWAGSDDAVGGGDDVLIDQTVIGWGRIGSGDAAGEWTKEISTTVLSSVTTNNKVYIRVYNDVLANKGSAQSGTGDSPANQDVLFDITSDLAVNTIVAPNWEVIPEPTFMLVSGLALLLLRKRK
jgi:hypothetical protein